MSEARGDIAIKSFAITFLEIINLHFMLALPDQKLEIVTNETAKVKLTFYFNKNNPKL